MLIPLLSRLAVLAFGAIQALLTLRLVMGLVDLPQAVMQFRPSVVALSEPLIDPFRRFEGILGGDGLSGAIPGGGFLGGLDTAVVVALVGWSLIELVVLGVLRIFGRRGGDSRA